ncbi:MAG: adenylate/guanylate cyclase domain-containing protein [Pseudomonadota bacterium]
MSPAHQPETKVERDALQRVDRSWLARFPDAIARMVRAGTDGFPSQTKRRLIITNVTAYLAAASAFAMALSYAFHDLLMLRWAVIVSLITVSVCLSIPFLHRFGAGVAAPVLATWLFVSVFAFAFMFGRDAGMQLNYFGAGAVAFVIFGLNRLGLILVAILSGLALHFAIHFLFLKGYIQSSVPDWFIAQLYVVSATSIMAIIAIVVWYALRVAADAEERSERLLRNVLPDSVAEQLKNRPNQMIAERYDAATVLFADLSGFTPLSRQMDAADIIDLLNTIFTKFDEAGAKAGTEKIKTIGDAYMAVSGLPLPNPNHARDILELAKEMQQLIALVSEQRGLDLSLRIGIATGPVAAGVIGQAKFAYDVWGETVNLASRLESHGQEGRIQVCEQTYAALAETHAFEKQAPMEIKGIGRTQTWLLASDQVTQT